MSFGTVRDLTSDQLAVVEFGGTVTGGSLEPVTREIVSMHTAVYRGRVRVRASRNPRKCTTLGGGAVLSVVVTWWFTGKSFLVHGR